MSDNVSATPPSVAPSASRLSRGLRFLVLLYVALSLVLLTVLMLLALGSEFRTVLSAAIGLSSAVPWEATVGLAALVLVIPIGVLAVAGRRGWLTWPVLALLALAMAGVQGWLASDVDVLTHAVTVEELSPVLPGSEESFAHLMKHSKQAKSPESEAFAGLKLQITTLKAQPRDAAAWREAVRTNRAGLETDWAALAPHWRWLEALNAFRVVGDLTPARIDADIISFKIWRTLSQHGCARATLLAEDGRGDEAAAILCTLIEAGRKLQPSSRTLVRSMIGVVVERQAVETALLLLETTPPSAAARPRFIGALGADQTAALARRTLLIEYALQQPTLLHYRVGGHREADGSHWASIPLNALSVLVFNPRATMNLYGEAMAELSKLAEKRELGKLEVRNRGFLDHLAHEGGIKNLGGRMLLGAAVPAYGKILESLWKTADLRADLRKRCEAP